jgi:hypothetical protein
MAKQVECKSCNAVMPNDYCYTVIDGFWICPCCQEDNEVDND